MASTINLTIGGYNSIYDGGYMVDGNPPFNFVIDGNNNFDFTIYNNATLDCTINQAADIYCDDQLVGHLPISDTTCVIDGNADVYGMGIRIGLYLQWTSTLLTFFYHPSTFSALLVTNCTFSIAVSIAYLAIFRSLYNQEVFIVAMLLSMTLIMIPLEILDFVLYYINDTGREPLASSNSSHQELAPDSSEPPAGETPYKERPGEPSYSGQPPPEAAPAPVLASGPVARLRQLRITLKKYIHHIGGISWFIATAFLLIIVAFQYWGGTKKGKSTPPNCHPKLLWTYYTQAPYSSLMKAMYLLLAILAGLAIVVYILVQVSNVAPDNTSNSPIARMRASMNRYRAEHHTYLYKAKTSIRIVAAMFFGIVLGFSVAYMETVIYQNSVNGVRSISGAGQIIPLIVGVTSFLFTVYVVLADESVQ